MNNNKSLEFFSNPAYEYVGAETEFRMKCPFCGGSIVMDTAYYFRRIADGQLVRVETGYVYGECSTCGAV